MASVASHTTWGHWRNVDCTPGSTLTCQNFNTTKLGLGDQFTCFTSNNSEIVPLSVSVMQDLAWARRFCAKNPNITLFFANQECPPPQDWDFSWRTRKFRSEVATNTPPTICDAGPTLGERILCFKSQEYPFLWFWRPKNIAKLIDIQIIANAKLKIIYMSHFSYSCKMRYPLNLVLENWEYLWFY